MLHPLIRILWNLLRWVSLLRGNSASPAYRVISLGRPERLQLLAENQLGLPQLERFPAINGYSDAEVQRALKDSGLTYHRLDFPTNGTLACFLSKHAAFRLQVDQKLPLLVLLEDDVRLDPDFDAYVRVAAQLLFLFPWLTHLRLAQWGEGYITNVRGAERILHKLGQQGIRRNIDNQLRRDCGPQFPVGRLIPPHWQLVVATNAGDCLKTGPVTIAR
jgi:hypothetical protein